MRAMTETADLAGEAEGVLEDIVKGILSTTDRVQIISSMITEQSDSAMSVAESLQEIA